MTIIVNDGDDDDGDDEDDEDDDNDDSHHNDDINHISYQSTTILDPLTVFFLRRPLFGSLVVFSSDCIGP